MRSRLLLAMWLILSYVPLAVWGQTDTEFWFVAPEISIDHGDRPIKLGLSAEAEAATVEIYLPAKPDFPHILVDVPPFSLKEVDLTSYVEILENFPANQILDKGLFITSSQPISAYYQVERRVNQDIFTLKGRQALGNEFYIPSQTDFRNIHNEAAVDLVATQDGTEITIMPSKPIRGNPGNQPINVMLDRGETYSIRANSGAASAHLEGTHIESNKPIAVTNSDDSIVNEEGSGWDLVGDQLVPVELLGTEYIVVTGNAFTERVYITATAPDTEISYQNPGLQRTTLDEGQTTRIPLTRNALYLTSNKPVYVWHLTGIRNEPAGALIPPINCTGSQRVNFVRPGGNTFQLILLTEQIHADGFVLNGSSDIITADDFDEVVGTDGRWVATKLNLAFVLQRGAHQLINTSGRFHLGVLGDSGPGGGSYGYFSGYSSLFLGEDRTFCLGETVKLDAGENKLSYNWSDGSTGQFLEVDTTGTYWVESRIPGCLLTDTISLEGIDIGLDLGKDTSLCEGENLILDASTSEATYTWQDGSTDPQYNASASATYVVTVQNEDCQVKDSVEINFIEPPTLELGTDTLLCQDEVIMLDVFLPEATYRWSDGTQSSMLSISESGSYGVERNFQGCVQTDSLQVFTSIDRLDLPGDTTLCLGDTLEFFFQPEATRVRWENGQGAGLRAIADSGIYSIELANRCQTLTGSFNMKVEDCTCQFFMANVITPNQDGVNDILIPEFSCELSEYHWIIYDRWGNQVYETLNPDQAWDGRILSDNNIREGIYYWQLNYKGSDRWNQSLIQKQGYITLLR